MNDHDTHLHANVPISVVKFHLCACLNPTNHPGLVPGDRRHHNPGRGLEIRRFVAQHYRRVLFNHCRSVVYGCQHIIDNYILAFDTRFTGDALDTTHGYKRESQGNKAGLNSFQVWQNTHQSCPLSIQLTTQVHSSNGIGLLPAQFIRQ